MFLNFYKKHKTCFYIYVTDKSVTCNRLHLGGKRVNVRLLLVSVGQLSTTPLTRGPSVITVCEVGDRVYAGCMRGMSYLHKGVLQVC